MKIKKDFTKTGIEPAHQIIFSSSSKRILNLNRQACWSQILFVNGETAMLSELEGPEGAPQAHAAVVYDAADAGVQGVDIEAELTSEEPVPQCRGNDVRHCQEPIIVS